MDISGIRSVHEQALRSLDATYKQGRERLQQAVEHGIRLIEHAVQADILKNTRTTSDRPHVSSVSPVPGVSLISRGVRDTSFTAVTSSDQQEEEYVAPPVHLPQERLNEALERYSPQRRSASRSQSRSPYVEPRFTVTPAEYAELASHSTTSLGRTSQTSLTASSIPRRTLFAQEPTSSITSSLPQAHLKEAINRYSPTRKFIADTPGEPAPLPRLTQSFLQDAAEVPPDDDAQPESPREVSPRPTQGEADQVRNMSTSAYIEYMRQMRLQLESEVRQCAQAAEGIRAMDDAQDAETLDDKWDEATRSLQTQ